MLLSELGFNFSSSATPTGPNPTSPFNRSYAPGSLLVMGPQPAGPPASVAVAAPVATAPRVSAPVTSTTGFQSTVTPASAPFASGASGGGGSSGGPLMFSAGSMFGDNPGYQPMVDYSNVDLATGQPKRHALDPWLLVALLLGAVVAFRRA